jgi:sulfur-carrier protein adenylyltransferase/sulfurtransferase
VGKIGIVDFDRVDASNLQRQVLYRTDRIGTPKAQAARDALLALNPGIEVIGIEERLAIDNVDSLVEGYDIVLDGADNFATRYLVNDAAVKHGFSCVHGSVFRFEGQVSVFRSADGPCYRCLYPEPPPVGAAPSCAEAGVLGVLPGVVGLLMAIETIKLIIGAGDPLVGQLLTYDALGVEFRTLRIRKNPQCPVCSGAFPGYREVAQACSG